MTLTTKQKARDAQKAADREGQRRDHIDAKRIAKALGPDWWHEEFGDDGWRFTGIGRTILVSFDPDSEPGVEWVHASISYHQSWRMPTYGDLKQMHAAVFGSGHAYQCFVPPGEHVNITANVLHLWGRLDGQPALPNFGRMGTI